MEGHVITPQEPEDTAEVRRTVALTQLIHLMSEYQRLGAHRDTYLAQSADDTFVRGCGIIAGTTAIIGAICAVVGAWSGAFALLFLAAIPTLLAIRRGLLNHAQHSARIDLFDHGVTVYRAGERVAGFRWDTVEVRQQEIPFHEATPIVYSLELTGPGASADIDDTHFARAREWARAIQSAVTSTQLPGAVEAIDNGETVYFGDIGLNLDALLFSGQAIDWERIQLIDARSGMIRLKVDGLWISLAPVGDVPNFYIFNELAERLRLVPSN